MRQIPWQPLLELDRLEAAFLRLIHREQELRGPCNMASETDDRVLSDRNDLLELVTMRSLAAYALWNAAIGADQHSVNEGDTCNDAHSPSRHT
jgi:hypothetical protein